MKTSVPRAKNSFRHVVVQAADKSDYGNHGGHANDHSEEGKCRAQLIGPQRLQRNANGFGCVHKLRVNSPPEQRRNCPQV